MQKHIILFLAANPSETGQFALDREARAIQKELESTGYRECFEFETRWALEPLDLLRELRRLKPTVVHFSSHGGQDMAGEYPSGQTADRDTLGELDVHDGAQRHGLFFHGSDGRAQFVSAQAIEQTFGAAGSSVKLVILSACYSEVQAEALLAHVDCVVGMGGSIRDDSARCFAIGFYGGLGERESVAAAYKQGCAAVSLQGLRDNDRPQLKVRTGVDANQLVLAVAPEASRFVASPAAASSIPSKVDIGILTIRNDEFRAVLDVFPDKVGIFKSTNREYMLRHADAGNGERYTIAMLRQVERGHGEAHDAARNLIDDLAPRLVLVVGIASGLPSSDVKLGDVVISTRIHELTVEARKTSQDPMYAATGDTRALATAVANLADREDELGDWTTVLPTRPPVTWTRKGQLFGPPEWQSELRAKLEQHYGKGSTPRAPVYVAGPMISSDRLVKDPALLIPWLTTARNLLAVEMESGGVYRAVQERCPVLAIRGISDIVGLKRTDAWVKFACASAAAFTRAFLRTLVPSEVSVETTSSITGAAISVVMADITANLGLLIQSMLKHVRNETSSCQYLYRIYVAMSHISNASNDLLDSLPSLGSTPQSTEPLTRAHEELRKSVEELGSALSACHHLFRIFDPELLSNLNDILGMKMQRIGQWRNLLTQATQTASNNHALAFVNIKTDAELSKWMRMRFPTHILLENVTAVDSEYVTATVLEGRARLLQLAAIQNDLANLIKSQCKFADLFPDNVQGV